MVHFSLHVYYTGTFFIIQAVESKEVKERSMDSIFYQRVTDRDIGLIQSLYYLAQACEFHGR